MSAKQDRVRARTPTDLERKGFRKKFSEMAGVASDNRNRIKNMEDEVENGTWNPTLNNEGASYDVQQGWYQKIGKVVTLGWLIEAQVNDTVSVPLEIKGVPYMPRYNAFGGGVAYNVITQNDFPFECWGVDSSGVITALNTVFYPYSGAVILSGTICYTT